MIKIEFNFEPWNQRNDQRLFRAVTERAVGVVNGDFDLNNNQTDSARNADTKLVDEVTALVASGLEWLRWNGNSPEDVQARVNAVSRKNLEKPETQAELSEQKSGIYEAPDPRRFGESLSKSKKPRKV